MSDTKAQPKPQIFTAGDPTITRIVPELAYEIGLNESIILLQVGFWIKIGGVFIDDHWWTYQSLRDMQRKAFPYWGTSTINRAIQKLIAEGYVLEGNYNKQKYDKTRWLALNLEKLGTLKSIIIKHEPLSQSGTGPCQNGTRSSHNGTRSNQNGTTIPETPTEKSSETITESSTPTPHPDDDLLIVLTEEVNAVFIHQPDLARKLIAQHGEASVIAWCQYVSRRDNIPNPVGYVRSMLTQNQTPPAPISTTELDSPSPESPAPCMGRGDTGAGGEVAFLPSAPPQPPSPGFPNLTPLPPEQQRSYESILANFIRTTLRSTTILPKHKPDSYVLDHLRILGTLPGHPHTLLIQVDNAPLHHTIDQFWVSQILQDMFAWWKITLHIRFVAPSTEPHSPSPCMGRGAGGGVMPATAGATP